MGKPGRKKKVVEPVVELTLEQRLAEARREEEEWDKKVVEYENTHRIEFFKPIDPYQTKVLEYLHDGKKTITLQGANRIGKCLTYQTLISTTSGEVTVGELYDRGKPFEVYAWDGEKRVVARASAPFKKEGLHECYRLTMADGRWVEAADYHRILTDGGWLPMRDLHDTYFRNLHGSSLGTSLPVHVSGVIHLSGTGSGLRDCCYQGSRQNGEQPLSDLNNGQGGLPLSDDALQQFEILCSLGGLGSRYTSIGQLSCGHLSMSGNALGLFSDLSFESLYNKICRWPERLSRICPTALPLSIVGASGSQQVLELSVPLYGNTPEPFSFENLPLACDSSFEVDNEIISCIAIGVKEVYDLQVENFHTYFAGGLIHHNTVMGAVIVGSACLGIQPWDKRLLPVPIDKPPIKVRVLCKDWEDHARGVIVPELKRWLPVGEYTTSKNNVGVEASWKFKNKSEIELITNKQETQQHEGWSGHIVWADEPMDHDKYIANSRGLVDVNGIFLLTMTAVTESWILDEIVLNTDNTFAAVTEIPIFSNPYLDKDAISSFEAKLPENERIARIHGGWLNLVGLVWKGFKKDVHVIDPFEIPTDWPVVPMIDHHPSHPNAIGYYAVDQFDRIYVIDETYGHMSAEQEGDDIIRKMTRNAWRIKDAFIDPLSKGDMTYIKNLGIEGRDTFSKLKERLWHHGIELHVASKDKGSGIRNVEDMLEGPNKTPTLFFFRSLDKIDREGHIWEIQRWTYDENNKPKDKDDHFCENLYRMTLTGTKYTKMRKSGDNMRAETEFSVFEPSYGIVEQSQTQFNVFD